MTKVIKTHKKLAAAVLAVVMAVSVFAVGAYAAKATLLPIRPTNGVFTNAQGYFFDGGFAPQPMGDDTVIGYVVDERSDPDRVIFYFKPMEYEGLVGNIESIIYSSETINGDVYFPVEELDENGVPFDTDFGYAVFEYPGAGGYIKIDELHINVGGFVHPVLYDVLLSVEN
jgi:hypothetical protein